MKEFVSQVEEFGRELNSFVVKNDLPMEWFMLPDHLAIKCADRNDFMQTVNRWRGVALDRRISAADIHGRTLATAHVSGSIKVGSFGEVEWLEIMEPRPGKEGNGCVGLEHVEFLFPDFHKVRPVLEEKAIVYEEPKDNPNHGTIVVPFNNKGQEFKLNNIPLRILVPKELEEGIGYWL